MVVLRTRKTVEAYPAGFVSQLGKNLSRLFRQSLESFEPMSTAAEEPGKASIKDQQGVLPTTRSC